MAKEKELFVEQATELSALKEEMESTVAGQCEELVEASSHYTWKTKARTKKQYIEGQASSWTPKADVGQFLEVFGTPEDMLSDGISEIDVATIADSGINDVGTDNA